MIGLSGDLGAGKTHLVKGIALGLGFEGRVSSPSFGLLNEVNEGRLPLWHLDLYRLSGWDDIAGAGLDDYLANPAGVVVVEWVERWWDSAPADRLVGLGSTRIRRVRISILEELQRQIDFEDTSV